MIRYWPMTVTLTLWTGLALAAAPPAPGAAPPAASGYVLTDLGSLGGSAEFRAFSLVRGQ